jgi:hypothetical protein
MNRILRGMMLVSSVSLVIFGIGFFLQQSWATDLWLWRYSSDLSNIFVASILMAITFPIMWIALSNELAVVRGGALDLLLTFAGGSLYLFWVADEQLYTNRYRLYATVFALMCLGLLGLLWLTRHETIRNPQPVPRPVRISFALFALVLIPVGILLILQRDVFVFALADDASVLYGLVFVGASIYFIYGVVRPSWQNATGQLIGFLVYDIVLIIPYLRYLDEVAPERRLSLWVYLAVLSYSGLLAIYYLFIAPTKISARWNHKER